MRAYFFPLLLLLFFTCEPRRNTETKMTGKFSSMITKLSPIHTKMPNPKPGEWLYLHSEVGQTFAQYVKANPIKASKQRNKIYLLPLGDFDAEEKQILYLTVQYLTLYFNLKVVLQPFQSDTLVPQSARRVQNLGARLNEQLLTGFIMNQLLLPKLPQDAIAYIALTNKDLYPDNKRSFVFGQAYTNRMVGVSSMFRLREMGTNGFPKFLRRVLATTSHEIGHMLTIQHCIGYKCVMNGSNSLEESDSRPIFPCAECVCKLAWNLGFDLKNQFVNLKGFCRKNGLKNELAYYEKASKLLVEE
jgi:archaemetzincin